MPTFDITSTFDKQEVTNAVDQMNRENRRGKKYCFFNNGDLVELPDPAAEQ